MIRPAYSFDVFNPIPTDSFNATRDLYQALRAHHAQQNAPQDAPSDVVPDMERDQEWDAELEQDWDAVLQWAQAHGAQYRRWFDHQALIAYGRQDGYPWTRIGYTYDWGNAQPDDSRSKYGVSEFVNYPGLTTGA